MLVKAFGVFSSPSWKKFMFPWKSRPNGRSAAERGPYMAGGIVSLRGGMPLLVLVPELKVLGALAVGGTVWRPGSERGMMDERVGVQVAIKARRKRAMVAVGIW